jgi:homoserine kinase type II
VASLTPLTLSDARSVAADYGLELAGFDAVGGSVNSNFRLTTPDGQRFFLRIYEEQDASGALAEAELLDALQARGVPTAAPLRATSGARTGSFQNKPLSLYPWVEGVIRCQASVSRMDAEQVGAALARVHAASGAVRVPVGRFEVANLYSRLSHVARAAPPDLVQAGQNIRARLERAERERDNGLPRGLIHGDLFRDNVLWQGGHIAALIDFESASEGTLLFDLLVCVFAWCYSDSFVPELVRSMLGGYAAVRPVTQRELSAVKSEAAVACLRFATTRITDFSLRAPPGQAPARDFRRFLARLDAVEAGALDSELERLRG